MVSDPAGVNQIPLGFVGLRLPCTVMLPCFAHVAALDCSDLVKTGLVAEVVPEVIRVVFCFNASTNKWLPKTLRVHGKMHESFVHFKNERCDALDISVVVCPRLAQRKTSLPTPALATMPQNRRSCVLVSARSIHETIGSDT